MIIFFFIRDLEKKIYDGGISINCILFSCRLGDFLSPILQIWCQPKINCRFGDLKILAENTEAGDLVIFLSCLMVPYV